MNYFEKIEDYIWDRLSEADKAVFEAELGKDEKLAEAVQAHRREREFLSHLEDAHWREEMKSWRKEMDSGAQQTPTSRSAAPPEGPKAKIVSAQTQWILRPRFLLSTAAAIAGILIVSVILQQRDPYYEAVIPAKFDSELKSPQDSQPPLQSLYMDAYKALENRDFDKAESLFQDIKSSPEAAGDLRILQAIEYNQVISLLRQKKKQEARALLKTIRENPNHDYHLDAQKLSIELDK